MMSETPVEQMIDRVVKPVPKPDNLIDGDVYVTHEGVMNIGEATLRVYVLSDGKRHINADDMEAYFA